MKEQKKSSWGAVLVSFFKEIFLNFQGPGHLDYEETLTHEGKRRKNAIWRTIMLVQAAAALLPFRDLEYDCSGRTMGKAIYCCGV